MGGMRCLSSSRCRAMLWALPAVLFLSARISSFSALADDDQPDALRVQRLELMHHSFDSPLNYDNTLAEWSFSGGAVPTKSLVVVVPAVANRTGNFWHKAPIHTNNFELEFVFRVDGPEQPGSPGFAFWYSNDAFEPPRAEERRYWDFFGFKSNFRGLGVFFSMFDRENKYHSSVSVAEGDGTRMFDAKSDVPSNDGIYFAPLRNSPESLVFKLTVGPLGVLGQIRLANHPTWTDCFRLKKPTVVAGGYFGFSGATAPEGGPQGKKGDRVAIEQFHVYNLDVSQPGEDSEILKNTLHDVDVGDLLREHGHAEQPSNVADELRTLSRILYKHVSEQQPREKNIQRLITSQMQTIQELASEVRELQKEFQALTGIQHSSDAVNKELQGLRSLFHSHSKNQVHLQESLQSIQKSIGGTGDLSEFAARSASLEATIKQQATFSSWMIFGVIMMIAFFALFMWKRMRDMEKKHFL